MSGLERRRAPAPAPAPRPVAPRPCPQARSARPVAKLVLVDEAADGVFAPSMSDPPGGDEFDLIVRRYEGALRRFVISRIGRAADVDDLVQEALLRFARREPGQVVGRLESYLFQTAHNLIRDRARRQRVRRETTGEAQDACRPPQPHSPEQLMIDRETLARVRQVLGALPDRTRDVFLLHRVDGLRHRAIAEAMNMSVSTVEKHVRRAMAQLTRKVGRP